jgi:hypothetical protein
MGFTLNPFTGNFDIVNEKGLLTVADAAARAALTPTNGMVVVQLDTDSIYQYDGTTSSWVVVGGPGLVLGVTGFNSTPTANGLSISGNNLALHKADATNPGGVSTDAQTFAGQKTFSTGITGTLTGSASLNVLTSAKGAANGVASLDANALVPVNQLPAAALERLVVVADQTTRFALTTTTVQNGDSVLQTDTNTMYMVKDDTNLSNSSGYQVYSAGTAVNFSGSLAGDVTGIQGTTVVSYVGGATAAAVATVVSNTSGVNTGDQSISLANTLYVSKNGLDTNSGTIAYPFLTVGAAITAASSGTTVYIYPGTYTESIVLKAGVNLVGQESRNCFISGNMTASFTGTVYLHSLDLKASSGNVLAVSGASALTLSLDDVHIDGLSGSSDTVVWTNSNASSRFNFDNGVITQAVSASAKVLNASGAGSFIFEDVSLTISDNPNNTAVALAGSISFTHVGDQVTGQVTVASTAAYNGINLKLITASVASLTTASSSVSSLTNVVHYTSASPLVTGAGLMVQGLNIYAGTGQGFATTLNGGAGASPLPGSPLQLHATTVTPTKYDGQLEYDGTHFYITIGSTRYQLDQQPAVNLTGPITSVGAATSVASQTGFGSTFVMSQDPTMGGNVTVGTLTAGAGTVSNPAIVLGTSGTSGLYLPSANKIAVTIATVQMMNVSSSGVQINALTASRALTTNASNILTSSAVTDTELGYVSGVTSAIQTQLSNKDTLVTGDIEHTSFTYAGSIAAPTDVTGLAFANGSVRAFKAQVSVTNTTDVLYQVFDLVGVQKAASWDLSFTSVGDASLVTFSITTAGQVQYINSSTSGGTIKFRAKVLSV